MVGRYRDYLPSPPWMVVSPGGAIAALTVLAFTLFGDALRDSPYTMLQLERSMGKRQNGDLSFQPRTGLGKGRGFKPLLELMFVNGNRF
jgi:hypothetical protein